MERPSRRYQVRPGWPRIVAWGAGSIGLGASEARRGPRSKVGGSCVSGAASFGARPFASQREHAVIACAGWGCRHEDCRRPLP